MGPGHRRNLAVTGVVNPPVASLGWGTECFGIVRAQAVFYNQVTGHRDAVNQEGCMSRFKEFVWFIGVFMCLTACNTGARTETSSTQIQTLAGYLEEHGQAPEEYVVGKFATHDVVFLGEFHKIRHDELLVQNLIPRLHDAGVFVLATEFARREDQRLIDSLLSGDAYDETLAREITFRGLVHWGYKEYVDILRRAWELDATLPDTVRKFRILGVNCSPDWSVMKKPEDREVDSLKGLAWRGCGEKDWAKVVLDEVGQGNKVLVHCGMHHAFTEYLQPIVIDGKFVRFEDERFGRYVYNAVGKKAITIFLHSPWYAHDGYDKGFVRPAGGAVDDVMKSLGDKARAVGFDIVGSPFGELPMGQTVYAHGYVNPTLAAYCDGWIFQRPFSEYETVTYIDDFINEQNLNRAQQQSPNPELREATVEQFESGGKGELEWLRDTFLKVR
jgi:hypothetical protein